MQIYPIGAPDRPSHIFVILDFKAWRSGGRAGEVCRQPGATGTAPLRGLILTEMRLRNSLRFKIL